MSSSTASTESDLESAHESPPSNQFHDALGTMDANFACGGSLQIDPKHQPCPLDGQANTCPPIVVRFEGADQNKVQFPLPDGPSGKDAFKSLLLKCETASFGRGGENVVDEEYRQALKLDKADFAVNFHPHDYGIIDAISQTLFSMLVKPKLPKDETRKTRRPFTNDGESSFVVDNKNFGVVAELYKINVYSGPSGKFKAHVDTPRSPKQFGSLVVCLPCEHEGGTLRVSHKGKEIKYAWGGVQNPQTVEWAAFFSDCEHEVREVTSGSRVTLTYNLYMADYPRRVIEGVSPPFSPLNPQSYPMYGTVKIFLRDLEFMKEGGTLAFGCTHAYAHAKSPQKDLLPYCLKGLDAIMFTVLAALGLNPSIRPILTDVRSEREEYYESALYDYQHALKAQGQKGAEYQAASERFQEIQDGLMEHDLVGKELHKMTLLNDDEQDQWMRRMKSAWPLDRKKLLWLNRDPFPSDLALAYLTYGNESSLDWKYSRLAIIADIEPSSDRATKVA